MLMYLNDNSSRTHHPLPERIVAASALTLCLVLSHSAHAAVIQTFSVRSAWQAAAGTPLKSETFGSGAPAPGAGFGLTSGSVSGGAFSDDGLPQVFPPTATANIFQFSPNTTAFGGDWDLGLGGAGAGLQLTAVFANGTTQVIGYILNTPGQPTATPFNGFYGFVSDTSIVGVRYQSAGLTGNAENFYLDNVGFRNGSRIPLRKDLVVTGVPSWLSIPVASSNGNGTFTTTNVANSWWPGIAATAGAKLVAGDFNGDGKLDMVAAGAAGWQSVPVAFSSGSGAFTTTNLANASWASFAATPGAKLVSGDFDGDGKSDLALTAANGWASIPVAFSNGNGSFNVTNTGNAWWAATAATPGVKVVTGDVDNDGKDDLIMTGPVNWLSIPVAFSNGDGSFRVTNAANSWWGATAAAAGVKVVSGDFNGDGKVDLAMTGPSWWQSIPVAFSNGDGTFTTSNISNTWWAATAATAGVKVLCTDVDGDGKSDLVMTGPNWWQSIPVAFSTGNGTFNTTNSVNSSFPGFAGTAGAKLMDQY